MLDVSGRPAACEMAEEGFHDYTLATNLERLVAQLEQCFRGWMLTGLERISHMPPAIGADKHPTNVVRVSNNLKHRLPWREQPYILTLHVPYTREAELQAARKQQQQQQQQAARHEHTQHNSQSHAAQASAFPARQAAAAAAASATGTAAEREDLNQPIQQKQSLQPSVSTSPAQGLPSTSSSSSVAVADSSDPSGVQLDQRVQELIEEYRQLHLQLQEDHQLDDEQQQQQQQKDGAVDVSEVHLGLKLVVADDSSKAAAAEGGNAPTKVQQAALLDNAPGTEAAVAALAQHRSQQQQQQTIAALSESVAALRNLVSNTGSSKAAAAAADQVPSESEESEETSSRQVDLPAPEELVMPNSTALAAVQEAVRQDQSTTAVSRTWWPYCYLTSSSSSSAAAVHCARKLPTPYQAVASSKAPWWAPALGVHKLQRWFGVDLFVLLQPASYSKRLLDAAEASSLLSVGRLALSSSGVVWPLLLPVHDALRDAYWGCAQVGGSSVYFTADSIHVSRLPRHLTVPHQQITLFANQLAPYNAAAATACLAAVGQGTAASSSAGYAVWLSACCTFRLPDVSKMHWLQQQQTPGAFSGQQQQQQQQRRQPSTSGHVSSNRSSLSGEAPSLSSGGRLHNPYPAGLRHPRLDDDDLDGVDWDADSAWHPWAQQQDPIKAIELDLIWQDRQICDQITELIPDLIFNVPDHNAESDLGRDQPPRGSDHPAGSVISAAVAVDLLSDVSAADHWLLHVVSHGYSSAPLRQGRLGMRSSERHRRHVTLAAAGADWLWTAESASQVLSEGGRLSGVCPQSYAFNTNSGSRQQQQQGPPLDPGSFTTMLSALLTARTAAAAAGSLWELAGTDWWESRGEAAVPPLPPDSVLDSVIADLLSTPKTLGPHSSSSSSSGSGGVINQGRNNENAGLENSSAAAAAAGSSDSSSDLPRCAPVGSLLCRLALHALVFGNARAVAALWQRFVAQVRLHFWEERKLLPYMPAATQQQQQGTTSSSGDPLSTTADPRSCIGVSNVSGGPPAPDLNSCLLHQKLQMLNVCIWRRDKRLMKGTSQQQQQQQQQGLDLACDENGNCQLISAASSSFYSVGEDDDDDDDDRSSQNQEVDRAVVRSAESRQQQQQEFDQQLDDSSFQDAAANLDGDTSTSLGECKSGISGSSNLQQQAAAVDADEQQQQQPEGVAGIIPGQFLLKLPDQPLRIPIVQDDPIHTEDQIIQRQIALMQLAEATAAAGSSSSSNRLLEASAGVSVAPNDSEAAAAAAAADLLLVRQRLLAAPLLSDMSAFKAANPGSCLEDFLRWYSPKDWQQQQQQQQQPGVSEDQQAEPTSGRFDHDPEDYDGFMGYRDHVPDASSKSDHDDHHHQQQQQQQQQSTPPAAAAGKLSSRMTSSSPHQGSWQQLWSLAPPLPAAAQKPLLNPHKEGEQVLHYLETITPVTLFSQLVAAAVNEALELLAASRGALLPAAAAVVNRFRSMAAAVLRKGGGIAEALSAAAAQQQQQLAGDWQGAESGLSDIELELLLAEFHYVEQVVVLGESLLHHLPGQTELAARILHNLVYGVGSSSSSSGIGSSSSNADADDNYDNAGNAEARVLSVGGLMPVARLTNEEKVALMNWVASAHPSHTAAGGLSTLHHQHHLIQPEQDPVHSLSAAAAAAASSSSDWQQQVQSVQGYLGDAAQREWVVACGVQSQNPAESAAAVVSRNSSSSSSVGFSSSENTYSRNTSGLKLKGGVAAAVAAASGVVTRSDGAAAAAVAPPSRMYLQEADGEMRIALTIVSDQKM